MMIFIAKILFRLVGLLPIRILRWIAAKIGQRLYKRGEKDRTYRTVRRNITACFPELSPQAQDALIRASLIDNVKSMLETFHVWTRGEKTIKSLYREAPLTHDKSDQSICSQVSLDEVIARGQGCILLSPHIGNWEILGYYVGWHSELTSMYLPAKRGEEVNAFIKKARSRFGSTLVPTNRDGVKAFFQAIKRGDAIGLLPDQNPVEAPGLNSGAVSAPFFNIPAATITLPLKIALKSNAPVLLSYALRDEENNGFVIGFEEIHLLSEEANELNNVDKIEHMAARMNQAIEQLVRRYPSQYLWTYKRFKVQADKSDFYA